MFSPDAGRQILDAIFRAQSFTPGSTPHLSFGIRNGSELAGVTRQPITFSAPVTTPSFVMTHSAGLDFGTVDINFGSEFNEFRIYSAATGGVELARSSTPRHQSLYTSRTLTVEPEAIALNAGGIRGASDDFLTQLFNFVFRGGTLPSAPRYAGLLLDGTEISGGNYARFDCSTAWQAATVIEDNNGLGNDIARIKFSTPQNFLAATNFAGSYNALALYAASSGGSPLITIARSLVAFDSGEALGINLSVSL